MISKKGLIGTRVRSGQAAKSGSHRRAMTCSRPLLPPLLLFPIQKRSSQLAPMVVPQCPRPWHRLMRVQVAVAVTV